MLPCYQKKLMSGLPISIVKSFLIVLVILFSVQTKAVAENNPPLSKLSSFIKSPQGTFENVNAPLHGAKIVTVGIYGINIYNLDLKASTYSMSAYMWLRWKGDFDPIETLDIINLVKDTKFTKKALMASPKVLSNGEKYQILRIDGLFHQPFDVSNYPLDKQQLSLYIENSIDTFDKVFYVPDVVSTSYDKGLDLPGWENKGLQLQSYLHDYGTIFGKTGTPAGLKYSGVKFSFNLEREKNFFIWKLLIPLLIILIPCWLALFVHPSFIAVRVAMSSTSLLTIVLLERTSVDAILECASLVLMDKIYLLAIFNVALTLLQIIIIDRNYDMDSPSNTLKIIKIEKISFVVQILFFVICLAALLMQI